MKLDTSKKRLIFIIIVLLTLALLFFIYFKLVDYLGFGFFCIFHKITGFECPGCGMSRAIRSIMFLDFKAAFRYNALSFPIIVFMFYYFFNKVIPWIKFKERKSIPNYIIYPLLLIVILFGVLRNIPAFDFLRP